MILKAQGRADSGALEGRIAHPTVDDKTLHGVIYQHPGDSGSIVHIGLCRVYIINNEALPGDYGVV